MFSQAGTKASTRHTLVTKHWAFPTEEGTKKELVEHCKDCHEEEIDAWHDIPLHDEPRLVPLEFKINELDAGYLSKKISTLKVT